MAYGKGKNAAEGAWGLTSHPTVWSFAMIILLAVIALALLRHLFGSITVSAGTK